MRRWVLKASGKNDACNIYSETQMDFSYDTVEEILAAVHRIQALSVLLDTSVIHVDEFGCWSAIDPARLA